MGESDRRESCWGLAGPDGAGQGCHGMGFWVDDHVIDFEPGKKTGHTA